MSKARKIALSLGSIDDGAAADGGAGAKPPTSADTGELIKRAADAGRPTEEDDTALLARLTSSPAYAGKPSLSATPALSRPEEPQEPLKIMIPAYLNRALTVVAGERKVSKRWLVMDALRQAGFDVRDYDLFEDGRRFRGSARR